MRPVDLLLFVPCLLLAAPVAKAEVRVPLASCFGVDANGNITVQSAVNGKPCTGGNLGELLMRLEPDTRVRRAPPRGKRSRTGVVGVSKETYAVQGRRYVRYEAHWIDEDGVTQRRRFLVQRYGSEQALELAVAARRTGIARAQQARQREEASGACASRHRCRSTSRIR